MKVFRRKENVVKALLIIGVAVLFAAAGTLAYAAQEIRDWHGLHNIRFDGNSDYILMNDLDQNTAGYADYNSGAGWQTIHGFGGTFDGDGHVIKGLTINRPSSAYQGLFHGSASPTITRVGLEDVDITGASYTGALVTETWGTTSISEVYVTGTVTGTSSYTGGLVGYLYLADGISDSYSMADVSATSAVGGLVGIAGGGVSADAVTNSYAAGAVSGGSSVGGLVGLPIANPMAENSYYDTTVSGQSGLNGGAIGYTTTEMYGDTIYDAGGWDLDNTWVARGDNYPVLEWVLRRWYELAFEDWGFSYTAADVDALVALVRGGVEANYTMSDGTPAVYYPGEIPGSEGYVPGDFYQDGNYSWLISGSGTRFGSDGPENVPELPPGTMQMMVLGLSGVVARFRRRR